MFMHGMDDDENDEFAQPWSAAAILRTLQHSSRDHVVHGGVAGASVDVLYWARRLRRLTYWLERRPDIAARTLVSPLFVDSSVSDLPGEQNVGVDSAMRQLSNMCQHVMRVHERADDERVTSRRRVELTRLIENLPPVNDDPLVHSDGSNDSSSSVDHAAKNDTLAAHAVQPFDPSESRELPQREVTAAAAFMADYLRSESRGVPNVASALAASLDAAHHSLSYELIDEAVHTLVACHAQQCTQKQESESKVKLGEDLIEDKHHCRVLEGATIATEAASQTIVAAPAGQNEAVYHDKVNPKPLAQQSTTRSESVLAEAKKLHLALGAKDAHAANNTAGSAQNSVVGCNTNHSDSESTADNANEATALRAEERNEQLQSCGLSHGENVAASTITAPPARRMLSLTRRIPTGATAHSLRLTNRPNHIATASDKIVKVEHAVSNTMRCTQTTSPIPAAVALQDVSSSLLPPHFALPLISRQYNSNNSTPELFSSLREEERQALVQQLDRSAPAPLRVRSREEMTRLLVQQEVRQSESTLVRAEGVTIAKPQWSNDNSDWSTSSESSSEEKERNSDRTQNTKSNTNDIIPTAIGMTEDPLSRAAGTSTEVSADTHHATKETHESESVGHVPGSHTVDASLPMGNTHSTPAIPASMTSATAVTTSSTNTTSNTAATASSLPQAGSNETWIVNGDLAIVGGRIVVRPPVREKAGGAAAAAAATPVSSSSAQKQLQQPRQRGRLSRSALTIQTKDRNGQDAQKQCMLTRVSAVSTQAVPLKTRAEVCELVHRLSIASALREALLIGLEQNSTDQCEQPQQETSTSLLPGASKEAAVATQSDSIGTTVDNSNSASSSSSLPGGSTQSPLSAQSIAASSVSYTEVE